MSLMFPVDTNSNQSLTLSVTSSSNSTAMGLVFSNKYKSLNATLVTGTAYVELRNADETAVHNFAAVTTGNILDFSSYAYDHILINVSSTSSVPVFKATLS